MGLLRSVSHDETAPHFGHRRCTAAHCCRPRPKGRRPRGHVLRRACSRPIMAPTVLPIQFAGRKCHWRYASFSAGPGVLPAAGRWALCSERIPVGRLVSRQPLHHHGTQDQARRWSRHGCSRCFLEFHFIHVLILASFLDMVHRRNMAASMHSKNGLGVGHTWRRLSKEPRTKAVKV